MLSDVLRMVPRAFGRREVLSHNPAGGAHARPVLPVPPPSAAGDALAGEPDRARALLVVLDALAPVTRATFLALRDVTGLPDAVLLRALLRLTDAGLAEVEERRVGQSTLVFAISECGRELLGTPYKNAPRRRGPVAELVAAGRGTGEGGER